MDPDSRGFRVSRLLPHISSVWPIVVRLLWGFAEATAFSIVPDVCLVRLALLDWRQGFAASVAVVAGAIAGDCLIFAIARADPGGLDLVLVRMPPISRAMVDATGERVRLGGVASMMNDPFAAVPFKVYADKAGELGVPPPLFLLIAVLARVSRLLPGVLLAAGLGTALKRLVREHTPLLLGGYA